MNARLPGGLLVQGGVNIGRERVNNCFLLDDRTLVFDSGFNGQAAGQNPPGLQSPRNTSFCDVRPPFLTQGKGYVVYPLPWGLQASATFQSLPGPQILASYVARNAEVLPTLGRESVDWPQRNGHRESDSVRHAVRRAAEPDRCAVCQELHAGPEPHPGSSGLYNLINDNPVMSLNTRYGTAWQQPVSILPGRLLKVGAQWNF